MYVCSCFKGVTTKTVQGTIELHEQNGIPLKARTIHGACSGAKKLDCGSCFPTIAGQIKAHKEANQPEIQIPKTIEYPSPIIATALTA